MMPIHASDCPLVHASPLAEESIGKAAPAAFATSRRTTAHRLVCGVPDADQLVEPDDAGETQARRRYDAERACDAEHRVLPLIHAYAVSD